MEGQMQEAAGLLDSWKSKSQVLQCPEIESSL
jgi:hypothetical protein